MKKSLLLFFSCIACQSMVAQSRVVMAGGTAKDRFPKKSGVFRMSDGNVPLGIIKKDSVAFDTLWLLNTDKVPHSVRAFTVASSALKVNAGSETVLPDSVVWIAIEYDARLNPNYGFVMDRFSVATDDPTQPVKPFTVTLKLEESFPPMTGEDSLLVQKARVPVTFLDIGKVRSGMVIKKDFLIYNDGKKELFIRKIRSDSPSLHVKSAGDVILPGTYVTISMELNTSGRSGKESKTFQVYVNDPAQPEIRFDIACEIE